MARLVLDLIGKTINISSLQFFKHFTGENKINKVD